MNGLYVALIGLVLGLGILWLLNRTNRR